jgi:hypothetical protein
MSINEDDGEACLEIDAFEQEIRFVCRKCKKENSIKLSKNKDADPLPRIGSAKF